MSEDDAPTVIVTGASSGVGLATTHWLLEDYGANVVAVSRHGSKELNDLANLPHMQHVDGEAKGKGKGSLMIAHADASNDKEIKDLVENTLQNYSRLDALVLSAGTLEPISRIADMDIEEARKAFDINAIGVLSIAKHALPYLRATQGRIIVVSTGAVSGKYVGWGPYAGSKAAVNAIVRTLSKEEPDVVSVAVQPGKVNTKMQALIREKGSGIMTDEDHEIFTTAHKDDKLVPPDVVGTVLANLAIRAGKELNGEFVAWNDEAVKPYR